MHVLFRILNGLMAALFIFAAALQYNDDDLIRWMAIYLAAAACCLAAHGGKLKAWIPLGMAVICVGWSAIYAARGALGLPLRGMFAEWEMRNEQIVEEREMFGLLIVAAWMMVLAVRARRKNAPASTS